MKEANMSVIKECGVANVRSGLIVEILRHVGSIKICFYLIR